MNYQVVWKPEAERRLTEIWLNATDRQAVTSASSMIDLRLSHDPASQGESREKNQRILYVFPLAVIFKVQSRSKIVRVLTVWSSG
jgi:mRNA-degrading endonuclease RelE of RelBE toxin-antitoxin system